MNKLFQPTAHLKISITPDCNNNCPICLNKTTRSRNGQQNSISNAKIKELIDQASDLGMIGAYWTGGEPLVEYNKLIELIRYASTKDMGSTIVTNGGLIGAFGNYKTANKELLKKSGILDLTTWEIVESLVNSGLERIYFSIDCNHTTLQSANSNVYDIVPTEVVARAVNTFLNMDFAKKHNLEAFGYKLRFTATYSGIWKVPTERIIEDILDILNLSYTKYISDDVQLLGNGKGAALLRRLEVSKLGDAKNLNNTFLESRKGSELFNISCPQFRLREKAYDGGKYHGDLYIDFNGVVYTCGNHTFPIGNIYEESLEAIVDGVNNPDKLSSYSKTRKVFNILLRLSRETGIGDRSIGEAIKIIHSINPSYIDFMNTKCGSCQCLGTNEKIQDILISYIEAR
ncbi:radical SAM/SPASM domain-containing protein [Wukongibacter sp. M2B1]|uniref:radical SAM protein n=1 Tax=Wukongibacter sp. M2B1 TaxID=3088895 RepID=UPI003D793A39